MLKQSIRKRARDVDWVGGRGGVDTEGGGRGDMQGRGREEIK